ncbi:MAG: type III-A CRISPR-associated protein Csm2 [Actinobacteria bacterium]|nr:type III-A CRISPR-associated protein Csm2 [Actinomycetota bacterium]
MSNQYRQNAGRRQQNQHNPSMPDPRVLDKGFTENQEVLLDSYARKWGEFLAGKKLKKAQIRRFYRDIKAIESRIQDDGDFGRNKQLIAMLKAKAAYATARQDASAPPEFRELMDAAVKHAKHDWDQFKGFVQFFEAVVAYHYAEARD